MTELDRLLTSAQAETKQLLVQPNYEQVKAERMKGVELELTELAQKASLREFLTARGAALVLFNDKEHELRMFGDGSLLISYKLGNNLHGNHYQQKDEKGSFVCTDRSDSWVAEGQPIQEALAMFSKELTASNLVAMAIAEVKRLSGARGTV